ncbi:MAG: exonuclease domain-containing protein, partial [Pseudomonadota bacterium]
MNLPHKLVFVDLETTGANPHDDRITEIGVVTVENGVVSQWSSLVNPQVPISPFIEELTGINDGMVRDAPLFGKLAQDLMARLEGGLFIAHNAKFDYSFLRNAFQRVGMSLKSDVLCTVKLSRKLYPDEVKHNLGALIERHALLAQARHRALADADVLWQFWQKLQRDTPAAQLDQALKSLLQKSASPSHVEPDLLQGMPNGCGVYLFHDAAGTAIFVGKASHLRRRAQGHFNSGDALDQALAPLVKRVTWHSTTGDIGASLLEAKLLKDLQPPHNRHMRVTGLCSWRLANENSAAPLTLVLASELDFASATACYGLFRSRKKAEARLREVAAEHSLCLRVLGLEAAAAFQSQ